MSEDPERDGKAADEPKPHAKTDSTESESAAAASKKSVDDAAPEDEGDAEGEDAEDESEDSEEESEAAPAGKALPPAPKVGPSPAAVIPKPNYTFLLVASVIFFVADFGSKWWVVHHVEPKPRVHTDGWFMRLNRVENPGGAWGIFGDQPDYVRLPFFFLISAVAVVFVVSLYRKLEKRQLALKWALPLLLGGAAGNLLDRIRHQSVIDFLEFTIVKGGKESFRWPTFNVADIWICIGVGLMAIDMFTPRKPVPAPEADDEEEAAAPRRDRSARTAVKDETDDAPVVDPKEKPAKAEA